MHTHPVWLLPWAKLGRSKDKIYPQDAHPVACHLVDVAHVAGVLWSECLATSVRERWSAALQLSQQDASRWIAFWAGCHDIGKVCPAFQKLDQSGNAKATLRAAGLHVGNPSQKIRHDRISAHVLPALWKEASNAWPPFDYKLGQHLAAVIGGHHGVIPTPSEYRPGSFSRTELGGDPWHKLRYQILVRLADALNLSKCPAPQMPAGRDRSFFLCLAGLIAVADWIGSNRQFFSPTGIEIDWEKYCERSGKQARVAVSSLGWTGWRPDRTAAASFSTLFQFENPRPLQTVVERLVNQRAGPALLLVEAPMGEGKTEAALYAADRQTHAGGGRGTYVALPTMATSNGMFRRVEEFVKTRYSNERVNLQLLHGRTFLSKTFENLRLAAIAEDQMDESGQVVAEEWFAKDKKQGLLAPFAVGTIDQALLSVLQTKFGFVRLFGLAGKTVILDEVHAYDAYTSTILGRMLAWLNALGSPVVLLSATLPRKSRHRLIAEYLHFHPTAALDVSPENDTKRYPRVTIAHPDTGIVSLEAFSADSARALDIRLKQIDSDALGGELRKALFRGGTAAVICNTVNRAQSVFRELRDRLSGDGIMVELFHARFPLGVRQEKENNVLERYGKGHTREVRPARVLVATQVVEQSLDLDFDLMVTEFAPVDLVLQRAGRLHRHKRSRPERFIGKPELWLLVPDGETDGVPDFGPFEDRGNGGVYARYVLLRSYLVLGTRQSIRLPHDIEELVESAYSDEASLPDDAAWVHALRESRAAYLRQQKKSKANAQGALVRTPDSSSLVRQTSRDLMEEDDPKSHDSKVAKTREGDPTVDIVLLYRIGEKLSLRPKCGDPIDQHAEPRGRRIRQIIERSVSLSHKAWVRHFAAQEVPSAWQRCGALRFHRVAELDQTGIYRAETGELQYDEETGVELR